LNCRMAIACLSECLEAQIPHTTPAQVMFRCVCPVCPPALCASCVSPAKELQPSKIIFGGTAIAGIFFGVFALIYLLQLLGVIGSGV
ncbi:hypothetical protein ACE1AT_11980, partial [Pelatocladus sp. BLCC-F211]|uniref:hypothetical protein n=1 Tax=Pelatocladus sp. BLCC-F211 TaxID=3342752 RepID=UPI0035B77712